MRFLGLKVKPRQKLQTVLVAPEGATPALLGARIFDRVIGISEL